VAEIDKMNAEIDKMKAEMDRRLVPKTTLLAKKNKHTDKKAVKGAME